MLDIEQLTSNIFLIVSAIISLIVILLFRKLNRNTFNKEKFEQNVKKNLNYPYKKFRDIFKGKFKISKVFMILLIIIFTAIAFMFLYVNFGIVLATVFCIPVALITTLIFTEFIWFLAFVIRKIIAIENLKMNTLFSLVITMLIFVFINIFLIDIQNNAYTFNLAVYNLMFCYVIIVFLFIQLLQEAMESSNRTLTFKNLWKSAFLIIFLFLIVLSMMSYVAFVFDENSFSGLNINTYFDFFYYTCVTFATVGFGDIVPISTYARGVCVLTIITSILSITILLSTVITVKKVDEN